MPDAAASGTDAALRRPKRARAPTPRTPVPTARRPGAQSIRGRMELDGLGVPAGAPWLADFRAELLAFPAGRHDDQVDAIGLVARPHDEMVPPARPKQVRPLRDRCDSATMTMEAERLCKARA